MASTDTGSNLQRGKAFNMTGYDHFGEVQSLRDDMVRYVLLHNHSSHVLLAEVHAMAEPTTTMPEPARLVDTYAYGACRDGWKGAYAQAMREAVRLAGLAGAL